MASSSDSEEDAKEREKLLGALDPSFVIARVSGSGSKSGSKPKAEREEKKPAVATSKKKEKEPVSLRQEMNGDEQFFKPYYSVDLSADRQKFIAKKLSKGLEEIIDEVDTIADLPRKKKKSKGILLFADSTVKISDKDLEPKEELVVKREKPQLRKKRHLDGSDSEEEDNKCRAVAVDKSWVESKNTF